MDVVANENFMASPNDQFEHFRVYRIRWFMLYLLVMCTVCMSMQFVQYSIIADVVVDFYKVSYEAVNWSIMIMMLLYIPFNILGIYIINRVGIRTSVLLGIFGASVGTWIKIGSSDPDRYWVVLLGQAVISTSQIFLLPLPAYFASVWFGTNQVALASGIGVSGLQLGVALGFLVPPMLVKSSSDKNETAHNMFAMNLGFALMCTLFFVIAFFFFKAEPPTPPSLAQKQMEELGKSEFKESTKRVFTNASYNILLIAFSINGGVYNTIPALLNQIVLHYYPDGAEDAGRIGLTMLIVGIFGAIICGYVMDKVQRFKLTTVIVFAFHLVGMLLFTLALLHSIVAVYISTVILGFFMAATYSVGLQVAAELTYPEPESTSSGYILTSAEIMSIILIHVYSFVFYTFGPFWSNVVTCAQLTLSTLLILCMPFNLRRHTLQQFQSISITEKPPL